MREILDAKLLDALDAILGEKFEGEVWRVTWATRDPLTGSYSGGRWSPDNASNVLRLSVEQLQAIGVADPLATRIDYEKSQPIGAAAYLLEYDGLIVRGAR